MSPEFVSLAVHADGRGRLSVLEFTTKLSFPVRRQFIVTDVPAGAVRGRHANRRLREVLICVRGSMVVTLDDGSHCSTVRLDDPNRGLYLPNMVWSEQREYSHDAVVVVLASLPYDETDAIRDYDEFLRLKQRRIARVA